MLWRTSGLLVLDVATVEVFRLKTMEEVAKVILRKDLCLDAGQGSAWWTPLCLVGMLGEAGRK